MPLGLGRGEKTVSVESFEPSLLALRQKKHPTHLQFFFAIFLGFEERYIFVDVHGIVYSWCFKTLGNHFLTQATKTYHEIP